MKIMIVDDHPEMRKVLRSILTESAGGPHEILECETGEDAVVQCSLKHPDCVLMDVQLRGMNGFAAAELIHVLDPEVRIVFVSSYNTPSHRQRAMSVGATGFVSKDNLSELESIVRE